jgi:hypothetical protein
LCWRLTTMSDYESDYKIEFASRMILSEAEYLNSLDTCDIYAHVWEDIAEAEELLRDLRLRRERGYD